MTSKANNEKRTLYMDLFVDSTNGSNGSLKDGVNVVAASTLFKQSYLMKMGLVAVCMCVFLLGLVTSSWLLQINTTNRYDQVLYRPSLALGDLDDPLVLGYLGDPECAVCPSGYEVTTTANNLYIPSASPFGYYCIILELYCMKYCMVQRFFMKL